MVQFSGRITVKEISEGFDQLDNWFVEQGLKQFNDSIKEIEISSNSSLAKGDEKKTQELIELKKKLQREFAEQREERKKKRSPEYIRDQLIKRCQDEIAACREKGVRDVVWEKVLSNLYKEKALKHCAVSLSPLLN